MPGTHPMRRRKDVDGDGRKAESKSSSKSEPPISEIQPDDRADDEVHEATNPAGTPPQDPLVHVREGINSAPCSLEFWVLVGTLILCVAGVKYLENLPPQPGEKVFTKDELAKHDAASGAPVYLAILGQVFDVTKGDKYYGENGGYSFFTGKDATRAYVTGDFKNDLNDDISDFTPEQMKGVVEWRDFYIEFKDYEYAGKLEGAFYDSHGKPTAALKNAELGAIEGLKVKERREAAKKKHPNCNSRWSQAKGGEVWCDEGYPRKILETIQGAKPATRCACFKEKGFSDVRQVYPGCAPDQQRCKTAKKESGNDQKHGSLGGKSPHVSDAPKSTPVSGGEEEKSEL